MPNRSGVWTVSQQYQAYGSQKWTQPPSAPTIGTATAGEGAASVTFTAPSFSGNPGTITGYKVTSSPGCVVATGCSSPICVSCLTNGTAYTFRVQAQNAIGYGAFSCASNSATPAVVGQQAYTSAGTYCWTAPCGVTSVSVVAVGSGGGGWNNAGDDSAGGGGAGLGYKNNYSVTPGSNYSVVVGAATANGCAGNDSYFVSTSVVKGGAGGASPNVSTGGSGGTYTGDGGGNGGSGANAIAYSGFSFGAGGGAGGYSGNGGSGVAYCNGQSGSGGGGGAGSSNTGGGYGGGGVGILGQGSNGAGGVNGQAGFGGSGGNNGGTYSGGAYGGGVTGGGVSGSGAVRIIWPGTTRSFPSTCTGNL